MSYVFVVDKNRTPLDPVHPGRARFLLKAGHAAILRHYPFTIMLKDSKQEKEPEPYILTWITRIRKYCPIAAITQELVRFDTQRLENPEIAGVAYQQGTLVGYELREYLLEKWGRTCAYCGATDVPLEVEHLIPKSRGGSSRVSNLTLSCRTCNQKKGRMTAAEFGFAHLLREAKKPLKDAAAVNATRWALYERLRAFGLPVEAGTGGRTKYNRSLQDIPKTHWLDAACTGASTPAQLCWQQTMPLVISAMGRHSRQMCRTNAYGFPDKASKGTSVVGGFRTGDMVRAVVTKGKKMGSYVGRIAVRATGSCNIKTRHNTLQGIHFRYCKPLHRGDGYSYQKGERRFPVMSKDRGLHAAL